MMILVLLVVIFGLLIVSWAMEEVKVLAFNISEISPDAKDLTPVGDALLGSGFVTLTSSGWENDFCTNLDCKGQVVHSTAAKILPNSEISSLSTKFTFSMVKSRDNETTGDGFVFFFGKQSMFAQGEADGHFGLFPNDSVMATKAERNPFFGIEFDTMMDVDLHDQDDNHLGVDINSAVSAQVAQANIVDVSLNDGQKIISWIDWNKTQNIIEVRISYDTDTVLKPIEPLLSYTYYLNISAWTEFWTGFSSSSSIGFEQRHLIHDWSFKASFEAPSPEPLNQSELSSARLAAVGGIAVIIIIWIFIVKFTTFGKHQHDKCMKLLPSKCQETTRKLFKNKKGKVDDHDEKSISTTTTDYDIEDEEDEEKKEEEKHNNDKPLSSSTSPPPQSKMFSPPIQSKTKHSSLTPPKSMHPFPSPQKMRQVHPFPPRSMQSSSPQPKMRQPHPPISKVMRSSSPQTVL